MKIKPLKPDAIYKISYGSNNHWIIWHSYTGPMGKIHRYEAIDIEGNILRTGNTHNDNMNEVKSVRLIKENAAERDWNKMKTIYLLL